MSSWILFNQTICVKLIKLLFFFLHESSDPFGAFNKLWYTKTQEKSTSKNLVENNIKENQVNNIPAHLKFDSTKLEATVLDYCDRNDIGLQLDELLVIEYYSRR